MIFILIAFNIHLVGFLLPTTGYLCGS